MKKLSRPMIELLTRIQRLTATGDGCTVAKSTTLRALAMRGLVSGKRWGSWEGWSMAYGSVSKVLLTDAGRKALGDAP